jgi:lipopolysaccharide/colanic/teichoic acid biosynthesis glycosyltransferase
VEAAHGRGVKVRLAPRTTELLVERGEYVPGQGIPLFELRPPILAGTDWMVKRAFDLAVGAAIVVIGIPLWALIALAIKLTSRGPVFYSDRRIGLGEQEFRMLKFRTMVEGADRQKAALERSNEAGGALFKIRDDPRVTPVGRVLRRLSLDEVPNVINVLRGEMSLVAPAAAPRLRASRSMAPAPLQRAPRHDRPVAGRRTVGSHLRRPRAPRLLLPRELVDLARRDDPVQDAVRRVRAARGVLRRRRSYLPVDS